MALFGTLATLRAQAPATAAFTAAFDYADELLRPGSPSAAALGAMAPGDVRRRELPAGAFVMEQVYDARPRSEGFFESHRKYIDLQVIVEGDEVMEVVDRSRIAARGPYEADRDLALYQDVGDASRLRVTAGLAAIFFPADVHMPSLQSPAGPSRVRKAVVKIPVA